MSVLRSASDMHPPPYKVVLEALEEERKKCAKLEIQLAEARASSGHMSKSKIERMKAAIHEDISIKMHKKYEHRLEGATAAYEDMLERYNRDVRARESSIRRDIAGEYRRRLADVREAIATKIYNGGLDDVIHTLDTLASMGRHDARLFPDLEAYDSDGIAVDDRQLRFIEWFDSWSRR